MAFYPCVLVPDEPQLAQHPVWTVFLPEQNERSALQNRELQLVQQRQNVSQQWATHAPLGTARLPKDLQMGDNSGDREDDDDDGDEEEEYDSADEDADDAGDVAEEFNELMDNDDGAAGNTPPAELDISLNS